MATMNDAKSLILEAAPALIASMPEGTKRTRLEVLHGEAKAQTAFSPMAKLQLESYARTMHRNPPTARTIGGLLEWFVK